MKNENYKILIVDDMKENIHLLGAMLNKEGYRIATANSGANALKYLETNLVDLILLDVMMPEMDGIEVCKKIKQNNETLNIPVIFVTAKTEEKDINSGFEAGGEDYILKPIKKLEVLQRVKNALQRHFAIKQLNDENELKNRLMSILSHDLKSPISNIVNTIELFNNEYISHDSAINLIKNLGNSAKATSMLLENVLHWINSHKNSIIPEFEEFCPCEIIYNIYDIQQYAFKQKNITNEIICNKKNKIKSDKELFNTIIRNLINNSIKFTPIGGKISTTITVDDDKTTIVIEDSGIGMSEETIQKLLDKSSNYTTYGTQYEKGTGLGFNISLSFIELLKGDLKIESVVSKGTKMIISLP